MSLINEALKKARAEGAQEEARRRGAPYTSVPLHIPARARRRWLVPALAGAAVALLVVGGGVWLAARPQPAAESVATVASLPAPVPVETPPPVPVPVPVPAPPARAQIAEPGIVPPPAAEPKVAPPPPAPPPRPPPPSPAPQSGSFARVAELPGGVVLKLEFIVWSDKPFAQVNDSLIEPGESIAGYRLVEVEREKVIFEGPEGKIEIRVR